MMPNVVRRETEKIADKYHSFFGNQLLKFTPAFEKCNFLGSSCGYCIMMSLTYSGSANNVKFNCSEMTALESRPNFQNQPALTSLFGTCYMDREWDRIWIFVRASTKSSYKKFIWNEKNMIILRRVVDTLDIFQCATDSAIRESRGVKARQHINEEMVFYTTKLTKSEMENEFRHSHWRMCIKCGGWVLLSLFCLVLSLCLWHAQPYKCR